MFNKLKNRKRDIYFIIRCVLALFFLTRFVGGVSQITSGSMEPSIHTGDIIVHDVARYGGKTPSHISFPLFYLPIYLKSPQFPSYRIWGYSEVARGDCVVFLPTKPETKKEEKLPPEMRICFIKRAIGLAKDTIAITNGRIFVNGKKDPYCKVRQYVFKVRSKKRLPDSFLKKHTQKVEFEEKEGFFRYTLTLTYDQIQEYNKIKEEYIIQEEKKEGTGKQDVWPLQQKEEGPMMNDMKEVKVPYQGYTIDLNENTHPLYILTLKNVFNGIFTVEKKQIKDNGKAGKERFEYRFYLNSKEIRKYTFKQDYLFMVGDNYNASFDSRFWGFLPKSHVKSRAFFVIFNKLKKRFFKSIP